MNIIKITLASVALAALAACHPGGSGSGPGAAAAGSGPAASGAVALVNGTPVSRSLYDYYLQNVAQGKNPADLTQQQREEALDTLVRATLVSQEAEKDGTAKDPDTQDLLELARLNALQQAFSLRFAKDNKPTDQELHTEYDAQVAKLQHSEYQVRNILVPTEEQAQKVIAELNKGGKFDELARRESTDSSKISGGDLGWLTPDRMPKPFADAVLTLRPGEYTHTPVQTQYGWHVIQLEATRPLAPPTFDSVKTRVEQIVLSNKFKAYVDGLAAKAQIDKKI